MKPIALALTALLSLSATGCVVRATGGVATYAYVESDPALVEVSPGVYVIEDYGEPVFYSGGTYWLYRNNVWYRSRYYDRGWVYVDRYRVPGHVSRIDRPHRYTRYRSNGPVYRSHNGRVVRSERRVHDNRRVDRRHDNRRIDNRVQRREAPRQERRRDDRRRPDVRDNRDRDRRHY